MAEMAGVQMTIRFPISEGLVYELFRYLLNSACCYFRPLAPLPGRLSLKVFSLSMIILHPVLIVNRMNTQHAECN